MKNRFLSPSTADDIDRQVEKVLRGLGNPEPPLRLEDLRELLRLDRQFYSTTDSSVLTETLSRLKVASRQLILRPMLIVDAIKKWDLRAFYLPDRKRILIDEDLPKPKRRWTEGHEIIHGILPWHAELMLGDNDQTLVPECHDHLEAEANYGAGQLLFLRDRFVSEAIEMPFNIETAKALARSFNNTLTSTVWRLVESGHDGRSLFALVSCHPHPRYRSGTFNPQEPCRYFIRSPLFARNFGHVTELELFGLIKSYCLPRRGGPLGQSEFPIRDANGQDQVFLLETFYNGYEALTIGSRSRSRPHIVAAKAV